MGGGGWTLRCSGCGAEIEATSSRCPSCGTDLPSAGAAEAGDDSFTVVGKTGGGPEARGTGASAGGPRQGGSRPGAGGAGTDRPIGRPRSPGRAALLVVATLGLYAWYWALAATGECERFDPEGPSPNGPVKLGVAGLALGSAFVLVSLLGTFLSAVPLGSSAGTAGTLLLAGFALTVLGTIPFLFGMYQLWRWVGLQEGHLGFQSSLSPLLMLALYVVVGGILGPVVLLYIVYRTQKGMNRVWEAAARGYEPAEGRAPRYVAEPQGEAPR